MTLDSKSLKLALAELSPICGKRSPLPLASCVRIDPMAEGIRLVAANGEAQASVCVATWGHLKEMVCVTHRTLLAMLPSSGSVDIVDVAGILQIKSGESLKELPTVDWSGMSLFKPSEVITPIAVDCVALADAVQFCGLADNNNSGFDYGGILHLKSLPTKFIVEMTDGRKAAYAPLPPSSTEINASIRYEFMSLLCPVLREEGATLALNGNLLWAESPKRTAVVKLSEISYPNTEALWDRPARKVGTANAAEFRECFETVMAVYDDEQSAVTLEIGRDEILVKYKTRHGAVESPLVGAFKPFDPIHVNPMIAIPALKAFDGDVELSLMEGGDKANGLKITQGSRVAVAMLCRGS